MRRAFTLIEMLVVLGIIAILAAMTIPTVLQSVERSHRAACTSNLRQIGGALNLYANDYDGFLYPQVWNDSPVWEAPIGRAPKAGSGFPMWLWASAYLPYTGKSHEVFRCPSDGRNGEPGPLRYRFDDKTPEERKSVSYMYVGLDIWRARQDTQAEGHPLGGVESAARDPGRYLRRISHRQEYQGQFGKEGWVVRDKDFFAEVGFGPHYATVHGVGKGQADPDPEAKGALRNVSSNVLLFDGSVTWRPWWDG